MPPRRSVALLAMFAAAAPSAGAAAGEPDRDPWFGRDKVLHFGLSASIAAGGYAAAAPLSDSRTTRPVFGGSLALGAGIAKELWDANGAGDASWRDFTWDLVGTATGLLFAGAIDWMIGRLTARGQATPTPSGLSP